VPYDLSPNEFGAQGKKFVINHWLKPVAWAILEHSLLDLTCKGLLVIISLGKV